MISEALRTEARKAFVAYEKVFVERVAKMPGGKLDASNFENVLATDDEARVRGYIDGLNATRRDLESALIV